MDEDLKDNCRAVLLSGAGALSESQFLRDYKELVDAPFPLRGRSVSEVLRSLGGFYISKKGGTTVISAAPDEKTAHLASLIARTKKKVKGPRGRRPQYGRSRLPPPRPLFGRTPPRLAPAWQAQQPKPRIVRASVTPPKAKLANPPIIPQRQSLSVQNRLSVISRKEEEQNHAVQNGFMPKLAEGTKETILNEQSESATSSPKTSEKESLVANEEYEEEATFVDIQWLQGRIRPRSIPAAPKSTVLSLAASQAEECSVSSVSDPEVKTHQVASFSCHVEELIKLTRTLGLEEPQFKFMERKPHKSKPLFVAKLKIGNEIFSSFPFESSLKEESQEHVAKFAIEELKSRVEQQNSVLQEEVDEAEVVNRLYILLVDKQNGVFDAALGVLYKEQFNCVLPEGWLKLLEKSPLFSVERHGEQRNIVYPRNKPDVSNGLILCKDINENIERPSFQCSSFQKVPPKILLPEEDTWDVYVANVSPDGIWVRLIGEQFDKHYDDVINDLEIKMLSYSDQPVSNPEVGKFYAVKLESCWLRVELREIRPSSGNEDDFGLVFLIDHGDEDEVPLKDLRSLSEEFLDLPPQAVRCQLLYVDLSFEESQTYLINHVLGHTFVASVVELNECQINEPPLIVLFNTDVEGDAPPINVNVNVLEQVVEKLKSPVIQRGRLSFFKLTSVEENTSPVFQVKSKELEYLENILIQLSNQDLLKIHGVNAHPKLVHLDAENENEHVFIVKSAVAPNVWRRAVITGKGHQAHRVINVQCIDYGYCEDVKFCDILDLDIVLPPLAKYPKQAVQISLDRISSEQLNKGIVNRLRKLAPPDSFIMGRISDSLCGPCVELTMRVQPNNMILSINSDLLFNYQEFGEGETEISSQESTPGLAEYPVNKLGTDFFTVTVTMTSNPFNFVVQPSGCEEYKRFHLMMKDLQKVYESQFEVMLIPEPKDLLLNSAFAVKHPIDSQWYRVLIAGLINEDTVSIRYCDFGDLGVVPRDQLRFLVDRFQEVPTMAIRARLHGVKPNDLDWSNEQSLYFKTLVESKSFMARALDINSEPGFYTWRLSLQMVDVSKEIDIDLGEHLIREGMAIAK